MTSSFFSHITKLRTHWHFWPKISNWHLWQLCFFWCTSAVDQLSWLMQQNTKLPVLNKCMRTTTEIVNTRAQMILKITILYMRSWNSKSIWTILITMMTLMMISVHENTRHFVMRIFVYELFKIQSLKNVIFLLWRLLLLIIRKLTRNSNYMW